MTNTSIPLYEAMSTLRAAPTRQDPIPDDVLRRILQAATWALSGGNLQPWRLVAVRDAALKQQLGVLYSPCGTLRGHAPQGPKRWKACRRSRMNAAAADHLGEHLGSAPVILVACFNPRLMAITDAEMDRSSVVGGGSAHPAIQNRCWPA